MASEKSKDYEVLKNKGNDKFKAKNYIEALSYYTEAIECKDDEAIAYSNRALCLIYLKRYFEAKTDCDRAIEINPLFTKAYYRRATAERELFRLQDAIQDLTKVLELDSSFTLATKEIESIQELLEKDTRLDLKPQEKPEILRSRLSIRSFELRNQYTGTLQYTKDC